MDTMTMVSRQVRWLASVAATVAMLCMMGGSLILAEHYAQTGAASQETGNTLAGQPAKSASQKA